MIGERIELWHKEEYHYPAAHGFIPIMVSYIHEDELMHPAMLVVGWRLQTCIAFGSTSGCYGILSGRL